MLLNVVSAFIAVNVIILNEEFELVGGNTVTACFILEKSYHSGGLPPELLCKMENSYSVIKLSFV